MKKLTLPFITLLLFGIVSLPVSASEGTTATYDPLSVVLVSLGIGLVVGLVTVLLMWRGMSTVRKQKRADNYTREGSFSLEESRDLFLYSTVTRVRVNTSNNKR